MRFTEQQKSLLRSYRDKTYVSAILYEEHSNYYSFIHQLFSIPVILTSSAMTVINSSFNPDDMKIVNIILNASTSLILSLVSNFRFNERANNFKIASRKMNSLCHSIEDYIYNELDEEGNINMIRNFIKSYDDINESLDYSLINSIKNKITEKYKSSRTLPNSLNCIAGSSGILRNGEISEERNNV